MPPNDRAPTARERATTASEYHWVDSQATPGHAYIDPVILRICRQHQFGRILDLGCGNGILCRTLAQEGFDVEGCDFSESGIELARLATPQVRFHVVGVYDDPQEIGTEDFDCVICEEVIEHLYAPRALPRFARAVLKPGGRLIVTTPYYGFLRNLVLAALNRWDHHHSPLWEHGHIKFWSFRTLRRLLEEEGFEVERFYGIRNLPFLWRNMAIVARKRKVESA